MEPVTLDSVLDICAIEQPLGVITQLGGQTPLRLAQALADHGVPILGTSPEAIDLAEDRGRFGDLLARLGLSAPPWRIATTPDEVEAAALDIGYPVLVRPSYVLGGRAMAICDSPEEIRSYLLREQPEGVILVDRFLEGALEFDIDALCDGSTCWIAAVMEHVEAAGIHSGDSACVLPPQQIAPEIIRDLEVQTAAIATALGVVGLINVQYALADGRLYVIEADPRASRTIPFVAKATGVPLVRHALRVMLGEPIAELGLPRPARPSTSPSRRRCCRSRALPGPIRCWARRCAPPARSWASHRPSALPSRRPSGRGRAAAEVRTGLRVDA